MQGPTGEVSGATMQMSEHCLSRMIEHWSLVQPNAQALIYQNRSVTYGELQRLSSDAGRQFGDIGIPAYAPLSMSASKEPTTIAAVIALSRLAHPILLYPEGLGQQAKSAVCAEAGVAAEIIPQLDCLKVRLTGDTQNRPIAKDLETGATPLILTTSGSTGVPKGVRLSDAGIRAFFDWSKMTFQLGPGRRVLSYAPLNFDLSLLEVWSALDAGAATIMITSGEAGDSKAVQAIVDMHRPHLIEGVPMLFQLLLSAPTTPVTEGIDVIITGEAASKALRSLMKAQYPRARFHNVYGATETNNSFIFSTDAQTFGDLAILPIGKPICGTSYKLVGESKEIIVGVGAGELHTATPFCSYGYTNPNRTSEAFYDMNGSRFYKTGDIVQRNGAGELIVIGRRDFIVKIRGIRINIKDVESAIESYPGISAAVVLPISEPVSHNLSLHAVFSSNGPISISPLGLRKHCVEHLPRSALPSRFTHHVLPIPRTPSGKKDRRAVMDMINGKGA